MAPESSARTDGIDSKSLSLLMASELGRASRTLFSSLNTLRVGLLVLLVNSLSATSISHPTRRQYPKDFCSHWHRAVLLVALFSSASKRKLG